jgi:hypothetical protein
LTPVFRLTVGESLRVGLGSPSETSLASSARIALVFLSTDHHGHRNCNVENSCDPFQSRQHAYLATCRHNIAIADGGESYQAKVQKFGLAVRSDGTRVKERARAEDFDGNIEGKPLHAQEQVNASCGKQVGAGDGTSFPEIAKQANDTEAEYGKYPPFDGFEE